MTVQQIALALSLTALTEPKKFRVEVTRPAKTYKNVEQKVTKQSIITGIFGNYADLPRVAAAVTAGLRDEPELPKHIAHSTIIGGTRFWEGYNNKFYLPIPLTDDPVFVSWFIDGEKTDFANVEALLLASEKPTEGQKEDRAEKRAERYQERFCVVSVENVSAILVS